ncbi:leucine-rich repeat protein [Lutibacter sp. TH_r2]|uniref:leucine-rich repeat protein n=1 Tax=Lutibacter sp. TH_r2 TaxID=3082083 RepID=UPI002955DA7E|nr:leucine-rich repeat protein [Lutibacter sp. TH_r2]MDV7186087.1 leucine-rich repeat protein [Lutibacter sp. TH_r2]
MKRNLLLFFIFLCAFAVKAQQYTLTDDDVVVTDGVIMSCSYDFTLTDIIIPETLDGQTVTEIWGSNLVFGSAFIEKGITSIVFPETLLKIGRYTFYKNELTEVIIPDSVIEIGDNAFRGNQLTSVTLSDNLKVLETQVFTSNNLTSITIPEGVTEIGDSAFSSNSLTSVSIPNSVTNIGEGAFLSNSLTSITLPTVDITGFINWIDEDGNTYSNGAVVTNLSSFFIAQFAQTLTDDDVVVVDGIITSCTLDDTTTSITIPEVLDGQTIIGLGDNLFSGDALTAVDLPETVTTIGDWVFYNCNLTSIALPSGLSSIGDRAFSSNSLTEVLLPESLTSLGSYTFAYNNLIEVNIPGSVTVIEDYAFRANYDLAKVTINEGVTSIGENAFGYCYDLTDLSIPNSVTYIGAGAFDGYTSKLASFTLPSPIKTGYTVNWIDSNSVEYTTGAEVTDKAVSYTANFEINTYVISGTVSGADGVSLTLSGDVEEIQTVTASGDTFNFSVEYNKSVVLTASKLGYLFDTEEYSFPNIYGDKTETNFTASINEEINTYVPDDNFEQALIDLGYDADLDDYVLTENINTITSLDVASKNIADLTGIEDFVALTNLNCYSNALTSLDVSNNLNLNGLQCYYNKISTLDVSANTLLQTLYCGDNLLTTLDVSLNTALVNLGCTANQLKTLDLSSNLNLRTLGCPSNELISLDVSANTALTYLVCESNQLTSLDVSVNTELTNLSCSSNSLTSLDLSANTALTSLSCYSNSLTRLNVKNGNNIALTTFYADENPNLTCIQVDDAEWSTTNWTDIDAQSYFNEESCFTYVPGDNFEQALIDLGYDTILDDYVLTENINTLTSLDVGSKNIADLTGIEDFPALTYLRLSYNNLTTLDVSNNIALEKLYCGTNALTSLDVSANTALTNLNCDVNELTSLDVSANTALINFRCDSNNLTSLNIANGNNVNFTRFWAYSNPNLTCIQVDDAEWSTTNWTNIDTTASFSEDCSSTLATDNYEIENFKVYPNPSNGDVYISVSEEAAYQLVNLTGQVIKQGKLVDGVNNLNLTGFNKGMYFVKIKTDNAIHTEKLIFK